MPETPVRVAVANDYEIVIAGVAAALAPYADRIHVVELASGVEPSPDVDIVLYDTFGQPQGDRIDLERFSVHGAARVVIFTWNVEEGLVRRALDLGVAGYISKTVEPLQLVEAVERVYAGEQAVVLPAGWEDFGRWPGDKQGLSNRESEVLALIGQGFSNNEIAEQTHLSTNTLKTYIRSLYRKIGATQRAQAVIWGVDHGFAPDHVRRRDS